MRLYTGIQIHFCLHHLNLKRKGSYHSATICSCARFNHYISGILVKIIQLKVVSAKFVLV